MSDYQTCRQCPHPELDAAGAGYVSDARVDRYGIRLPLGGYRIGGHSITEVGEKFARTRVITIRGSSINLPAPFREFLQSLLNFQERFFFADNLENNVIETED